MDVFAWSMPFVIEKVTEMLYYILQPSTTHEGEVELPKLPEGMSVAFRNSLSESENKAVELASKLGQYIDNGEAKVVKGEQETDDARDRIKKKVRSIARMARMFKTLRQENETVIRLKGVCPGHKLSPGLLLAGKDKLESELDMFSHVRNIDSENELRPEQAPSGAPQERDFVDDQES
jgi:serine/threonine-protein phosphatase 2B catalytic subunit